MDVFFYCALNAVVKIIIDSVIIFLPRIVAKKLHLSN